MPTITPLLAHLGESAERGRVSGFEAMRQWEEGEDVKRPGALFEGLMNINEYGNVRSGGFFCNEKGNMSSVAYLTH